MRGLQINRCAVAGLLVKGTGAWALPTEILLSALARLRGSPVSCAPLLSASNSRLREIAINEFYTKVGERSSAIFLGEKDFFKRFKGLLIGGPSPTKEEFEKGNYLHHEVQKRIVGLFDVAYTNEDGLPELVDAAKDALSGMAVIKEKSFMDRF